MLMQFRMDPFKLAECRRVGWVKELSILTKCTSPQMFYRNYLLPIVL